MVSTRDSAERGSSSNLTKFLSSAPWSLEVWIQSIQGRRSLASTGPVAPKMIMGLRSHQPLKIAITACISPTLLWSATAMGVSVTLA